MGPRLYLYAILGRVPTAPFGLGLRDELLSPVIAGGVVAVVGEMDGSPAATADTVRGHDAVVRRLAEISESILPARFGTVEELPPLREWLEAAADGLAGALRLVAGREQMTLHVFDGERPEPVPPREEAGCPPPVAAERLDETSLGPGARYLAQRRRHRQRQEDLPELAQLRARLDGFVRAERVEPRDATPLRASVYHLIERGRSAAYREAVETNAALVAGVRLRVSGPFPPYAFVPEPNPSTLEHRVKS
jgi:hypothetical protein